MGGQKCPGGIVGIYWPPRSLQILYKQKTRHQTVSVSPGSQMPSRVPSSGSGSAIVIHKVVAAGLLGHRWGRFRDLDVLQVQEPQLHLHAQQRVQVTPGQLAGHVLPQQGTEAINPDAVLGEQAQSIRGAPGSRTSCQVLSLGPALVSSGTTQHRQN